MSGMALTGQLSDRRLRNAYRLEATLSAPLDLGPVAQGQRQTVTGAGGRFTGPELNGRLLP
jgi:hypothetical protein